jgi:hypothetical protein
MRCNQKKEERRKKKEERRKKKEERRKKKEERRKKKEERRKKKERKMPKSLCKKFINDQTCLSKEAEKLPPVITDALSPS